MVTDRAANGTAYDLVVLGNDAADTGDFQVGIRLAHELGWPVATGIKNLTVSGDGVRRRAASTGASRRPTRCRCLPWSRSRRASTCPGTRRCPGGCGPSAPPSSGPLRPGPPTGLRKEALRVPASSKHQAAVLGHGADAVPDLVRVLDELGVLP